MKRSIKILGTGKYLPKNKVLSTDIDSKLKLKLGSTEEISGVNIRYNIKDETSSFMGAMAAKKALKDANLNLADIDCIVSASGISEQEIPCMASLIQKKLGGENSGIPSFDVNSTCLSFVTAFDLLSYLVNDGKYNNVLIVSSEITSIALNWEDPKSRALFGDGAAAVVISRKCDEISQGVLCSDMKTFSCGSEFSEIRTGGSRLHNQIRKEENKEDYMFYMDGKKLYKLSSQILPSFLNSFLEESGKSKDDIKMVIPHQASLPAMELMRKKLGFSNDKFMSIVKNHGNVVAASIPMALHEAIKQKRISRGDLIMFFGISAGVSIGAVMLEY